MEENRSFYDAFQDSDHFCLLIKHVITFLLIVCIFGGLAIALFSFIDYKTNSFVTEIVPINPNSRSIEKGSGLIIEQIKEVVKLGNAGVYDVLAGFGTIIDHFIFNYPIVSLNMSYIRENLNVSYKCSNITTFVNGTNTLTADSSIILSPNPWNPENNDATIIANITYVRNNLNLNTLSVSSALNMSLNQWNPTNGDATLTLNQEYINANLNLSSLLQGNGILLSTTPWNPSTSPSSTLAINETYIYSNLNISSLNATNNISITPANPWNPLSSGNSVIQLNGIVNQTFNQPYIQQGFFAIFNTTKSFTTGIINGWTVSVPYTYTKGGFNESSGIYTVPVSGIYEVNLRAICSVFVGPMMIQINGVNQYQTIVITTNTYYIVTTMRVNAGDTINIISTSGSKTITGSNGGVMPYFNYFGITRIGT